MILSQMAFALGAWGGAGQNPDAFRLEHGVERIGELACAVPDQELDCSGALAEVHQDVAGCLCRPRAAGMRGDAGEMDAAGLVLDDVWGARTRPPVLTWASMRLARTR